MDLVTESWRTIRFVLSIAALLAVLAGCATAPKPGPASTAPAIAEPRPGAQADYLGVLAFAVSLRGARYRAGGESPETGFDCSGFVRYVYGRLGIELPRNSADMAAALLPVPAGGREAGDLVFFNTNGKPFSHVGIYLGDGRFVHAPSTRTGKVMVSNLAENYWRNRLTGVRRAPTGDRTMKSGGGSRYDDDVTWP
jgi:cell wall-associated NlpC family hydrolase